MPTTLLGVTGEARLECASIRECPSSWRAIKAPLLLRASTVEGCLACDLLAGRVPLPGGVIHQTEHWIVEHCVGPLGIGTLAVKPKRHVTRVSELTVEEAGELGPLITRTATVVDRLIAADQVYVCLWSHDQGEPGHIHFVVQPVTREMFEAEGFHGPALQVAMFGRGEAPEEDDVTAFADAAREAFAAFGERPAK